METRLTREELLLSAIGGVMVSGTDVRTFCFEAIRAKESMYGALVEHDLPCVVVVVVVVVVAAGCAVGEVDAVMLGNGGNGP